MGGPIMHREFFQLTKHVGIFLPAVVVCKNFFGRSMLAGYFFQNHPLPL